MEKKQNFIHAIDFDYRRNLSIMKHFNMKNILKQNNL